MLQTRLDRLFQRVFSRYSREEPGPVRRLNVPRFFTFSFSILSLRPTVCPRIFTRRTPWIHHFIFPAFTFSSRFIATLFLSAPLLSRLSALPITLHTFLSILIPTLFHYLFRPAAILPPPFRAALSPPRFSSPRPAAHYDFSRGLLRVPLHGRPINSAGDIAFGIIAIMNGSVYLLHVPSRRSAAAVRVNTRPTLHRIYIALLTSADSGHNFRAVRKAGRAERARLITFYPAHRHSNFAGNVYKERRLTRARARP